MEFLISGKVWVNDQRWAWNYSKTIFSAIRLLAAFDCIIWSIIIQSLENFGNYWKNTPEPHFFLRFINAYEISLNSVENCRRKVCNSFWKIIHWISFSKILFQTFLRQFFTDLDAILYGGIKSLEKRGSAVVFLISLVER